MEKEIYTLINWIVKELPGHTSVAVSPSKVQLYLIWNNIKSHIVERKSKDKDTDDSLTDYRRMQRLISTVYINILTMKNKVPPTLLDLKQHKITGNSKKKVKTGKQMTVKQDLNQAAIQTIVVYRGMLRLISMVCIDWINHGKSELY